MDNALKEANLAVDFDLKKDFENAILHYERCCKLLESFPDLQAKRLEYLSRINTIKQDQEMENRVKQLKSDDSELKKKVSELKEFEQKLNEKDDVFGRLKKIGYESVTTHYKLEEQEELSEEAQVKLIMEHAQNMAAMDEDEDENVVQKISKKKDENVVQKTSKKKDDDSADDSDESEEYSDERLEKMRKEEKKKKFEWKRKNEKKFF